MKLSIGIVGLPNVGKSTLFNALLKKQQALAANYPFATIEPNVGVVEVPDERLSILAKIVNTQKIVPAVIEFYDIAGLVRGASQGEGLGNKFLSHIREVAAIAHVVRLFEDMNVIHVEQQVDALRDIKTVETELILADLATLEKQKEPKTGSPKAASATYEVAKALSEQLNRGISARDAALTDEQKKAVKQLNLLTMKPVIYVFNVSESQLENHEETERRIQQIIEQCHAERSEASLANASAGRCRRSFAAAQDDIKTTPYLFLNAQLENDVLTFSPEEQKEFLLQYHLPETGLNRLIKKAYEILNLISFLTAGEKEVRAWTIEKGTLAPQAAGVIHTDFEKHFIKADVIPYPLFVEAGGWIKAREQGKVQTVGRDYIMQDGGVVEFKVGI
ncbi:redox-regulated ATPase YchF [Candidatus Roizmanbacteria bacterium]|nr:redox-regulated ATPase YchF [Candidatus Roizmanbacteria bacterium]